MRDSPQRYFGTDMLRIMVVALVSAFLPPLVSAQTPIPEVAQKVRNYRAANEDSIIRELIDLLSIPNLATDTANIQRNAAQLSKMLQARGIETKLLPIEVRGPVVFGGLNSPGAKHTVIFYAHYDGQPVDPAAWTDGKPFEPALRDKAI